MTIIHFKTAAYRIRMVLIGSCVFTESPFISGIKYAILLTMITVLVAFHVVLMISSLLTTAGAALAAFAGHIVPRAVIATSAVTTILGVACGVFLMISLPLDLRCVVLISYVAAFMYAQVYVSRCNQVRSASADA